MIFLPLAPAFADELVNEESVQASQENSNLERQEVSTVESEEDSADVRVNSGISETSVNDAHVVGEENPEVESVNENDSGKDVVLSEDSVNEDTQSAESSLQDTSTTGAESNILGIDVDVLGEESDPETILIDGSISEKEEQVHEAMGEAEVVVEDAQILDEVRDTALEHLEEVTGEEVGSEILDSTFLDVVTHATATEEDLTVVTSIVTNDDNRFSFAENECTTTGNDTFYCVKVGNEPKVTHTDRIFAAIDAEGDKEIYIEKEGELSVLTNNQFDDDAPYYDELSNTAVWHRLIDGRHQIISFDFDEEEEIQLTDDSFNNMEPNRFGDAIVWQGWVGSDWEIFLSVDDERTMLTDNTTHDISPSINGTHVVWQSFERNVWVMKVYDIRSKVTTTVDDEAGGSIENPRFVLVYDSKQETGDVETRGYDLQSGEVIELGSTPVHLPDEIPNPDQTGEERALVTTITQLKPKTEDEGDDEPLPNTEGTSTPNSTDIVIPTLSDVSTTTDESDDSLTQNSFTDIVVPNIVESTAIDTSHIEDVIVTSYVESVSTTTSAQ